MVVAVVDTPALPALLVVGLKLLLVDQGRAVVVAEALKLLVVALVIQTVEAPEHLEPLVRVERVEPVGTQVAVAEAEVGMEAVAVELMTTTAARMAVAVEVGRLMQTLRLLKTLPMLLESTQVTAE